MAEITSDNIFDAFSILIDKKLQTIKFDETINAEIVEDKNSARGEYIVLVENTKFKAFSSVTDYRQGDTVMVTVPQGDYDNQKIIIGKYVRDDNTPMSYKSPFSYFINLTGNLLAGKNTSQDLTANDNNNSKVLIHTLSELNYQNYTQLGIEAQFSSWLGEYDTVNGHYGLQVILYLQSLADATQTTNVALDFDSDDFIGNVYDFQTYYVQQGLFDISEYAQDYKITKIDIWFYQNNDFTDINGEEIPSSQDNGFENTIGPNLFVKDVLVALGSSANAFSQDEVILYSDNKLNYAKNYQQYREVQQLEDNHNYYYLDNDQYIIYDLALLAKDNNTYIYTQNSGFNIAGQENTYIKLYECFPAREIDNQKLAIARWIHKDEENDEIYSLSFDDEVPDKYEIRWYHKRIGAPSPDVFAGVYWERYYGQSENVDDDNGDWLRAETNDDATNKYQVEFQPNVNNQTEELKVIILKNEDGQERFIAASNLLTFTNDDEVRNKQTIIDANALSIRYDDDEKGHYFLYNKAGDIGKNEDKEIRTLTAVFSENINNINEKPDLNVQDCSFIKWTFPTGNTMIVPMDNGAPAAADFSPEMVNQVSFTIKSHLNNNATNNTIRLDIIKDGLNYSAQVQPIFGTAGTSGSDYTIILQWENGENALNLSEKKSISYGSNGESTSASESALAGRVYLFDQSGALVDIQNEGAGYEFSWYKISVPTGGENPTFPRVNEEKDIYYPVTFSISEPVNLSIQPMIWSDPTKTVDYMVSVIDGGDYAQYLPKGSAFSDADITYSLTNNKFYEKLDEDRTAIEGIFYRRLSSGESLKTKIDFRAFDFVQTNYSYNPGLAGHISYDANNQSTYYYDKAHPAFVKYHDTYILDPWDEWSEVETYYEPIYTSEKDYSRVEGSTARLLTIINDDETTRGRFIIHGNPDVNSLYILKVDLTSFGDYDLSACFPVPIKNGEKFAAHTTQYMRQNQKIFVVDYIEGATDVRYSTTGETDFNKNPYQITTRIFIDHDFEKKRQGYVADDAFGHWQLLYHADTGTGLKNFLPALIEYDDANSDNASVLMSRHFDKPLLRPPGLYFEDTPLYGVQFITDVNIELEEGQLDAGTVLWTQPIFSFKDNYPSTTLNKWNGKDIVTDQDTGIITTNGLAAGKKERDNTFTGVVLGDWSRDDADSALTKETGVFGFNHGEMSYALRQDGTAFLGKDGHGRIYLSGQKSQIYSQNWLLSQEGMLLDIDDGIIKLVNKLSQGLQEPSGEHAISDNTSFISALNDYYHVLYYANPYIQADNWKFREGQTLIPSDLVKKEALTASGLQTIYNAPYWYVGVENASTLNTGNSYTAFTPTQEENTLLAAHANDNKFTAVDETVYRLKYVRVKIEEKNSQYELTMVNATTTNGTSSFSDPMLVLVIEKKVIKYKKNTTYGSTGLETSWQRYYLNTKTAYFYYKADNSNYFYNWYNENGHSNAVVYCDNENFNGQVYFFRANKYINFNGPTETVILNDNSSEEHAITFNYQTDALEGFFFKKNSASYDSLLPGTTHKYDPDIKYYYQDNNATTDKYITMSVAEQTYPLSIGKTKSVSSRKFRVNWDGDLYSEDGHFRNGIFQGEIRAESGYIGGYNGWAIETGRLSALNGSVYLDSTTGTLYGAEIVTDRGQIGGWTIGIDSLRGGNTMLHSSGGIMTNNIKIKATTSEENFSTYFGGLGYIGPDFTIAPDEYSDYGVGMYFGDSASSSNAMYKVNGRNLGFKWFGTWMSLNSVNTSDFGSTSGEKNWTFSSNTEHIVNFKVTNMKTVQISADEIRFITPSADKQFGIYARFA